jgi:hypothetical protein
VTKLTQIWKMVIDLWHHRCDLQHSTDESTSQQKREQMTPKIQAIYAQKDRLDYIDKQILDQPITNTLQLSTKQLKDWIQKTEAFVKKGIQRARLRLAQRNQSITNFFTPRATSARTQSARKDSSVPASHSQQQLNYISSKNFKPP